VEQYICKIGLAVKAV